jgi:hypothetical protein
MEWLGLFLMMGYGISSADPLVSSNRALKLMTEVCGCFNEQAGPFTYVVIMKLRIIIKCIKQI